MNCVDGYTLGSKGVCQIQAAQSQQSNSITTQIPPQPAIVQSSRPTDPNCITPNQNGGCISCRSGYYFNGVSCAIIPVPNCLIYMNQQCQSCAQGYNLQGNNCLQMAQQPNIQQPQPQTQFQSQSQQTQSQFNQTFVQQPVTQVQRDPNCKSFSQTGACLECFPSFFVSQATSTCMPQNSQCASNNGRGGCSSCYQGYDLINDACVLSRGDPNCRFVQNGICTQCSNGFYLSSGRCVMISSLCATSNPTTGQCLSCYPGYSLQNG